MAFNRLIPTGINDRPGAWYPIDCAEIVEGAGIEFSTSAEAIILHRTGTWSASGTGWFAQRVTNEVSEGQYGRMRDIALYDSADNFLQFLASANVDSFCGSVASVAFHATAGDRVRLGAHYRWSGSSINSWISSGENGQQSHLDVRWVERGAGEICELYVS